MSVFTDNFVCHFSILVSDDPEKCSLAWYTSKHGVEHNPMLHSQHLNFIHFFVLGGTHTTSNSLTKHKPVSVALWQVFLVGLWMELVFQSKLQVGKGLYWCGVPVCCNPLRTPVNLRTTGTEDWQFVLSFHCVKFVSVMSYVSLLVLPPLWAEMS